MQISYSRNFDKRYDKLPHKVQEKFAKRLQLFKIDPNHAQLNFHKLSGPYDGSWSINITGNIRAIFYKNQTGIVFINIGTHSELYE